MKHVVEKSIKIKAKPSEVWDALTNPEKTKNIFLMRKLIRNGKKAAELLLREECF